jgi:hypothetical protein
MINSCLPASGFARAKEPRLLLGDIQLRALAATISLASFAAALALCSRASRALRLSPTASFSDLRG